MNRYPGSADGTRRQQPQRTIISPDTPLQREFKPTDILARNQIAATKLAAKTGRLLVKLSMPETVLYSLGGDRARLMPGEQAITDTKFFVRAIRQDEAEYDVTTSVYDNDGVHDEMAYTVWQPSREGFVLPWGIKIDSASRTIYPRIRVNRIRETGTILSATAPLNNTSAALEDILTSRYSVAKQIEPASDVADLSHETY